MHLQRKLSFDVIRIAFQNANVLFRENALKIIVVKISTILCQLQCVSDLNIVATMYIQTENVCLRNTHENHRFITWDNEVNSRFSHIGTPAWMSSGKHFSIRHLKNSLNPSSPDPGPISWIMSALCCRNFPEILATSDEWSLSVLRVA